MIHGDERLSLKRGVLLLYIVCHTLAGSPVWGGNVPPSSVFVFHVKWGESDQTGLALANPTDRVPSVPIMVRHFFPAKLE